MTAKPIATFVVERQPGEGYLVTSSAGKRSSQLQREALRILDLLGHHPAEGPEEVDAWLGPVGSTSAYVRIHVQRTESGQTRYGQAWFDERHLPQHPACFDCRMGCEMPSPEAAAPLDANRVLEFARRAAEGGASELIPVLPDANTLHYCAALTQRFGVQTGNRITWITHTQDVTPPVHLQFRGDKNAEPCHEWAGDPVKPLKVLPVQSAGQAAPEPHRARSVGSTSGTGKLAIAVAVGVIAGFLLRPWFDPPQPEATVRHAPIVSFERTANAGSIQTPPSTPDARLSRLQEQLHESGAVFQRLRDFLDQDGLAADPNVKVVEEQPAISIREDLEFGTVGDKEQELSNTELRNLLDLFDALDALRKR